MTCWGRAKFSVKPEWLRKDSERMSQPHHLALRKAGYPTLGSCHLLKGMATGAFLTCPLSLHTTWGLPGAIFMAEKWPLDHSSGGSSPPKLPTSHLALSPWGQLSNFLRPERSLWFQRCLGHSLDESGEEILHFSPPGQCFQSDSEPGNVLLWGTGKGIIIFHLWARVSNLSRAGKNEWLGRWSIHNFNVWSANLHVSNQNNLPALSCFTAVPASEASEHTKGVKYCFWMYWSLHSKKGIRFSQVWDSRSWLHTEYSAAETSSVNPHLLLRLISGLVYFKGWV